MRITTRDYDSCPPICPSCKNSKDHYYKGLMDIAEMFDCGQCKKLMIVHFGTHDNPAFIWTKEFKKQPFPGRSTQADLEKALEVE